MLKCKMILILKLLKILKIKIQQKQMIMIVLIMNQKNCFFWYSNESLKHILDYTNYLFTLSKVFTILNQKELFADKFCFQVLSFLEIICFQILIINFFFKKNSV